MQIKKLLKTIKKLRHPLHGCDWDKKQTHESLRTYLLEETYEVINAIEKKSKKHLKEELGDLLLQVVLHSEIASENKQFNFNDVAKAINTKMIRRHPHVFAKSETLTDAELKMQWDSIKEKEKEKEKDNNYNSSIFTNINKNLPALLQALEISQIAKENKFDWKDFHGPLIKIKEEIIEIENELKRKNIKTENIELEIGDLLFSIVNLCRHLDINPEISMIKANNKFKNRFTNMLNQFENKSEFHNKSSKQKESIWQKIKKL